MPSIFKSFLNPTAEVYTFPNAAEPELDETTIQEDEIDSALAEIEELTKKQEHEPPKENPISFAQIQAQEILEDAERRAEELVAQRLLEAEKEIENAKDESKSEGYRQGYAEGLSQARLESQSQIEQWREQDEERVLEFLEKATLAREEMLEQTKQDMCDLSIGIAEKIMHISLNSSKDVISRMIQVATEKLKRREWVRIYVNDDGGSLAEISPELISSLAGLSDNVKIIPMKNDEPGTCIIEMPDEIIDASSSTQLQNIREILNQH